LDPQRKSGDIGDPRETLRGGRNNKIKGVGGGLLSRGGEDQEKENGGRRGLMYWARGASFSCIKQKGRSIFFQLGDRLRNVGKVVSTEGTVGGGSTGRPSLNMKKEKKTV